MRFDRVIAEMPACALDEAGTRDQRARYARLAGSVTRVRRETEAVLIDFDPDFGRQTLAETLAVEARSFDSPSINSSDGCV